MPRHQALTFLLCLLHCHSDGLSRAHQSAGSAGVLTLKGHNHLLCLHSHSLGCTHSTCQTSNTSIAQCIYSTCHINSAMYLQYLSRQQLNVLTVPVTSTAQCTYNTCHINSSMYLKHLSHQQLNVLAAPVKQLSHKLLSVITAPVKQPSVTSTAPCAHSTCQTTAVRSS